MSCERLRSLWETFLDGELPSRQMLELQSHLDACPECGESVAFSQAIRRTARQVVYEDGSVSAEFSARLGAALLTEARSEREEEKVARWRLLLKGAPRWGLGALAAAAAALLVARVDSVDAPANDRAVERQAAVTLGPEELLDLFIDYHTAPPVPQVTEAKLVPEFERDVGVKMPLLSLAAYGAVWQGGSVVRVPRAQRAAYLRYRTADAHSVTVYVYNPSRIPLHAGLKPRMLRGEREEPVYEGYRRGYSIAAQLRRGVGYAVTTDLDEARSAELVRAITSSVVSH